MKKYGLSWPDTVHPAAVELEMIRHGGRFQNRSKDWVGEGLSYHYRQFQSIVWPEKVWHKWNLLLLEEFCGQRMIGVIGPASCVVGETGILDPMTGVEVPIEHYWQNRIRPWVMTLGGPMLATMPVLKGTAQVFKVTLANGRSFTATAEHRVCTNGHFRAVSSIRRGQTLLAYEQCPQVSTLGFYQPTSFSDGRHWSGKAPSSRYGCPACCHFCDAQLQLAISNGPSAFPSQADAPTRTGCAYVEMDGRDGRQERTRLYQRERHPSNYSADPLVGSMESGASHLLASGTPSHICGSSQLAQQFASGTLQRESSPKRCLGEVHTQNFSPCDASAEYMVQRVAVASVEPVGVRRFFDLHVPLFNHYFAEGTIHHNSGKSREACDFALTSYYARPDATTVLVSSTELETLEMRIWAEIKRANKLARERLAWLPGHLIESRRRIITDERNEESEGRDFRNGLQGVACKRGGAYVGLGNFIGIKNAHVIHIADELQLMPPAFLDAISNLNKNRGFKCIGLGNPKDITDCLGKFCEPAAEEGGWDGGVDQTGPTKRWKTRFNDGVCVQLVGSDSPNMIAPPGTPDPYPFLIGREAIANDIAFYGRDSLQFSMMNEGRFPRGQGSRRVITRQMCLKFQAMEEPIWENDKRTRIGFLDAAYGAIGGDRCIFGELQVGRDVQGTQICALIAVMVVPVKHNAGEMPEDQIANFVRAQCTARNIIPENFFFDATGRGSLMGAFARLWSPSVQPIDFGGRASERFISSEQKILCREYYFNFVSELWFSVRLAIMSGQFRGMTEEVMAEGCMREWKLVGRNKTQVETKEEMKLKMGRSPDLFDALVAGVEGARRRGFVINRLTGHTIRRVSSAWATEMLERMTKIRKSRQLTYS